MIWLLGSAPEINCAFYEEGGTTFFIASDGESLKVAKGSAESIVSKYGILPENKEFEDLDALVAYLKRERTEALKKVPVPVE